MYAGEMLASCNKSPRGWRGSAVSAAMVFVRPRDMRTGVWKLGVGEGEGKWCKK